MARLVPLNVRVSLTDAAARIVAFRPADIQTLIIQVLTGSSPVSLGDEGNTTYAGGYPMIAGDVFSLSWEDFTPEERKSMDLVEIWGICDTGLTGTVSVFGWARQ